MSESEAFLWVLTAFHTSPSTTLTTYFIGYLPFLKPRVAKQEMYVTILATTHAPFIVKGNHCVPTLFWILGLPCCYRYRREHSPHVTGTQAGEWQVSSQIGQYIQYGRYDNSYREKNRTE